GHARRRSRRQHVHLLGGCIQAGEANRAPWRGHLDDHVFPAWSYRRRHTAVRAGPSPLPRRSAGLPSILEPSLTEESAGEGRHGSNRMVTICRAAFTRQEAFGLTLAV